MTRELMTRVAVEGSALLLAVLMMGSFLIACR